VRGAAVRNALANALTMNNTLEELNISSWSTDVGVVALGKALRVNATLHTLYLNYCEEGSRAYESIRRAVKFRRNTPTPLTVYWGRDDESD
jgi:hypothetical protein